MLCWLGGRSVDGDPGSCTGSLHWLACTASLRRRIARPGERETGRMGTVGGLGEPIKGSIVRTKTELPHLRRAAGRELFLFWFLEERRAMLWVIEVPDPGAEERIARFRFGLVWLGLGSAVDAKLFWKEESF